MFGCCAGADSPRDAFGMQLRGCWRDRQRSLSSSAEVRQRRQRQLGRRLCRVANPLHFAASVRGYPGRLSSPQSCSQLKGDAPNECLCSRGGRIMGEQECCVAASEGKLNVYICPWYGRWAEVQQGANHQNLNKPVHCVQMPLTGVTVATRAAVCSLC